MEAIYDLFSGLEFMAYAMDDEALFHRIHSLDDLPSRVKFPIGRSEPISFSPSFGDAPKQPTKHGDYHRFYGSLRLFSERAVSELDLVSLGHLVPALLNDRSEKFYWFWSSVVVDCLDEDRTQWSGHLVKEPAFIAARVGDAKMFTLPRDQGFQVNLWVVGDVWKERIKKARLKGMCLRKSRYDPKPWKS